uniref:EF-hand domain-containing protein n=1 Tax=Mus spicilegus TaxID=10103 RepID=A0A8C6GQJ7_MUSSI
MFDQSQIQEFKEAFNMIDQNRNVFIDKEDLHDMLASMGKNPTDEYLDAMMNEAPGPINFTMFLTMFGEKLNVFWHSFLYEIQLSSLFCFFGTISLAWGRGERWFTLHQEEMVCSLLSSKNKSAFAISHNP